MPYEVIHSPAHQTLAGEARQCHRDHQAEAKEASPARERVEPDPEKGAENEQQEDQISRERNGREQQRGQSWQTELESGHRSAPEAEMHELPE